MARREGIGGPPIGQALEAARTRQGLDLRVVEERTKIRLKYLRALEAEDWDVLPGQAYAIGFLRTYAELLGLDADELVRELRLRTEGEEQAEQRYPLGEPVLKGRERGGRRHSGRRLAVIGVVAALALIVVLALVGLLGQEDEPAPVAKGKRQAVDDRRAERSDAARASPEESDQPVTLRLILRDDVPVCLLGDGPQPLIDNQVLNAGSAEQFEAEHFELRFPEGFDRPQLELKLDGDTTTLKEALGPAAFRITAPSEVKPLEPPGGDCP